MFMIFAWGNPIGLGLFILMCGAALALVGVTVWLLTRADLPWADRKRR